MPMNQKYLLGFAKYQNAVNREMYEFTKYIQFVDGKDSRFKHYQATESLKYGVEVHVARHVITILETAKALKIPVIGMMKSMIDKGLGKYKELPAYGQFNLETVKDIMATMESKESQE